ncbi:NR2CA protein, partial [Hirundo rustica]|nr:NR2CA protein [Hirundo rustica]
VSSVLNRDVKHFGKQHLFDGSEETCWNSDQGASQWVTLCFPRPVRVSQLHVQFQGGFSSRLCTLEGCRTGEELVKISELYPQDSHAMQISFPGMVTGAGIGGIFLGILLLGAGLASRIPASFLHREPHRFQVEETVLDKLKITFGSSTDFFGRIVVYHLGVLGERL